ncbi:hypothetical protein YC2023_026235 [Brassica napus]
MAAGGDEGSDGRAVLQESGGRRGSKVSSKEKFASLSNGKAMRPKQKRDVEKIFVLAVGGTTITIRGIGAYDHEKNQYSPTTQFT